MFSALITFRSKFSGYFSNHGFYVANEDATKNNWLQKF